MTHIPEHLVPGVENNTSKLAHLETSGARSFSSWSLAAFILGYSLQRRLLELDLWNALYLLAGK